MKEDFEGKYKERYGKLNKAQKSAVDAIDGPVLIVAGPGSGKTEILSLRVGNILRQTDIAPSNILCLTFTDSAAINMRKRLVGLIGQSAYRVAIHTFHSFGVEVIDKNPEFFYNGANFIAADELARLGIVENILREMEHSNPLRNEHPEQGFVYAKAILNSIGQLKKGGLTPNEFLEILKHNEEEQVYANLLIAEVFDERITLDIFGKVSELISKLSTSKSKPFPVEHLSAWLPSLVNSLSGALQEAEELGKGTPLSKWKTKHTKKDNDGNRVLKDFLNIEKMYSLAGVYEKYRKKMHERGFYDFDDMLLETLQSMQKSNQLKYDLQEQFQYILVDEFQDTNDAQVRLLYILLDAEVNEGRPNIMAVGDDDQAIYKFQGAEISNILNFRDKYKDTKMVAMTENYRSTQDVLDVARNVIKKGEERLENTIPELVKELVSSNPSVKAGSITRKSFPTNAHEFCFVADEIDKLIKEGKDPNDIAVISRTHKKLSEIVAYLNAKKIPVNYERQQNVFDEPHIHQIITIGRFIATLARKNISEADELLPEILSYPFWDIDRKIIWDISINAEAGKRDAGRSLWLDVMRSHNDENIKNIANFFDELSGDAHTNTLEEVFDKIVGSHLALVAESEDEEDESGVQSSSLSDKEFISPFREYYFGIDVFNKNKSTYLTFLSSLRVFVHALREYKNGERLYIDDLVEFVELHEKNNLEVTDRSPFVNAPSAVNLMTAHKAKGLEFDTVFVISCQDDVWAGRSMGNKLAFPENLPISPAGDNEDDQLKLFYVALTRAKSNLYITSYMTKDNGKESVQLRFLEIEESESNETNSGKNDLNAVSGVLARSWDSFHVPPFTKTENALLKTLVADYQMPVTHLNNFLDITKGGPQTFLEQNLLRFPQSKTPSGAYGTAMHKTIELVYTHMRKDEKVPTQKQVLEWFEQELLMKRLSVFDYKLFLKRGQDALAIYYKTRKDTFDVTHKIELNFKNQGVVFGEAHITGKIDKMIDKSRGEFEVVDIKTGKTADKWEGKAVYEKIKLHRYKNQLIFYKLLVENSRDFAGKGIVKIGRLEFLEPSPSSGKIVDLSLDMSEVDTGRMRKLIEAVYKKIINLDFPDASEYSKDLKGVLQFEEDLLAEK